MPLWCLSENLYYAVTYTEHAKRKTVTAMDVVYALKRQGRTLYGFGGGKAAAPSTSALSYPHPLINPVSISILPHPASNTAVYLTERKSIKNNKLIIMSEETATAAPAATPAPAKKGKAPKSPKKAGAAKPKGAKAAASHPPTTQMVINAVKSLKERNGSSLQAVKKFIADTYKVDTTKQATFIRKAITKLVETGKLTQTKGTGASGSFKIPVAAKAAAGEKKAKSPKKKTTKPKKAASPKKKAAPKAKKSASPKKKAAAKPKKAKAAAPAAAPSAPAAASSSPAAPKPAAAKKPKKAPKVKLPKAKKAKSPKKAKPAKKAAPKKA
ncbi:Histone H1 [Folsomia candida]|uniref:Histone H4 n=2 Tax=Folsomia candida TaxID=158441 RepID=A0A226EST7_FOLCA|nr:Histone H1 [Folsomia candida]